MAAYHVAADDVANQDGAALILVASIVLAYVHPPDLAGAGFGVLDIVDAPEDLGAGPHAITFEVPVVRIFDVLFESYVLQSDIFAAPALPLEHL